MTSRSNGLACFEDAKPPNQASSAMSDLILFAFESRESSGYRCFWRRQTSKAGKK
jgi:hypothetical protein